MQPSTAAKVNKKPPVPTWGRRLRVSFNEFVTPKVVKFVYVLATIGVVGGWALFTLLTFTESTGAGIALLLLGPIGVILYLALIRMTLELYLAVTRMSQDINRRLPQPIG